MAWIKSFSVQGLAGRKSEVSHELNRDVNILWGTNGCGKTSLLKILHAALYNDATSISAVPFQRAEVVFYSPSADTVFTRTLDRDAQVGHKVEDDDGEIFYVDDETHEVIAAEEIAWKTTPEPSTPIIRFTHSYLPISRSSERGIGGQVRISRNRAGHAVLDEVSFDEMYANHIQDLWARYSTELLGKTTEIQQRGFAELARTVIEQPEGATQDDDVIAAPDALRSVRSFFRSQNLDPPRTNISDFSRHYKNNFLFRRLVNDMVALQDEIEITRSPPRKIEKLLETLFYGQKKFRFTRRNIIAMSSTGQNVPLSALASGEKQLLRLFLECLAAGHNSILVDEPEISLHVDWQHNLLSYLENINPKVQVIAATHSPEIMAQIPDSKIFEL